MSRRSRLLASFAGLLTVWATALLACSVSPAEAGTPPLERVRTIALKGPVGGLDHLAVDARRGRLFVANTANDSYLAVPRLAERPEQKDPEVWVYRARP